MTAKSCVVVFGVVVECRFVYYRHMKMEVLAAAAAVVLDVQAMSNDVNAVVELYYGYGYMH